MFYFIKNAMSFLFPALIVIALLFIIFRCRSQFRCRSKKKKKYKIKLHRVLLFILVCYLASLFVSNTEIFSFIHSKAAPEAMVLENSDPHKQETIQADIQANNALLWNISTNTMLFEKASNEKIAPASTTKLLTALTAVDYCNMEEEVLIGQEVKLITEHASRAWLYEGNRLTVNQLLTAMLLPSGNDAAYSLAVYAGRQICEDDSAPIDKAISVFLEAMNQKAAAIGAVSSNFTSPDGYDAPDQYTTVQDLSCIAKQFCKSKELSRIAGSYSVSDVWASGQEATYYNTNELINPSSPYYDADVIGLKTGTSEDAGYCLVSAAKIHHQLYVCIVMNSTEEGRWTDSLALYQAIR